MTPHEFIAKWKQSTLTERSACQQHFLDLCELLDQPKPAAADPDGAFYTFERGVKKTSGDHGWADVWFKDRFGWEYKGKHKDLKAAYDQLLQYREDLENPPLLVVCDMDRFEVHTNFTGTVKRVYTFDLDGLAEPDNLDVLRKLFTDPQSLKPGQTAEAITQQAAELFGQIADGMRQRGVAAETAAHFLMKVMFCMFAEDIGLLQNNIFRRIVQGAKNDPAKLSQFLGNLFAAMSTGGFFGADEVLHFNGGLFADSETVDLTPAEINTITLVNEFDWASVEPSIFGTLFERTLDPAKRSQIGAHYTSRADILTLLEPVMMTPLRREWEAVQAKCEKLNAEAGKAKTQQTQRRKRSQRDKALRDFIERLSEVTVLDPACGSGNFLYVALHLLLDLEKEVIAYAARQGIGLFPHVRPTQLAGIEINRYAQELAQVVIWIGYLQWMRDNGFNPPRDPVLEPIESIRLMDAILDLSNPEAPLEPEWPAADFIVGNPPFLGGKMMRTHLGDDYMESLFKVWRNRVRPEADLCCYWFEKASDQIARKRCKRAGLLATQGIRGGANRETVKRLKENGDIFFAVSDREWILDGAHVHISIIGFDDGSETSRVLDDAAVSTINSNLTATADITNAVRLDDHRGLSFMGDTKGGKFDITGERAEQILASPNPTGRPNSDVVVPWLNGMDVTRRPRGMWIVDFGVEMAEDNAAGYEEPFELVRELVYPKRKTNRRESYRLKWWIHVEPRPAMRDQLENLPRFLATTTVSKHRLFVWFEAPTLPDHQLIAFARSDDYFFGVLHSRLHEVWGLRQGTRLETRPRYTPTTCFETFPFPEPTDAQRDAIAAAAKELDQLRNNWLNPPEWTRTERLEFPGTTDGPWARYVEDANADGIGTVRYPRVVPQDEDCAKKLKKRTLTNLYNERPTWLDLAHQKLDAAVFAAYGWDAAISDDELLAKLLELNLQRAGET